MDEFMRHLESIEDKSSVDFRWPLQARNIFFEFLCLREKKLIQISKISDSGCKRDQQAPVRIPLPVQRLQTTHGLFRHAHLPCMCSGYGAIVLCTLYVVLFCCKISLPQTQLQFENVRASALSQMAMQFPWIARLPVVGWLAVGQHRKTASRVSLAPL